MQARLSVWLLTLASIQAVAGAKEPLPRELVLIDAEPPVYPDIAHQASVSGMVRIRATVGVDGRIVALAVVSGHRLLDQAAMASARHWRFAEDRAALPREVELAFEFKLLAPEACFKKLLPTFVEPYQVTVRRRRRLPFCTDCPPEKPIEYERCE